ncbi:MAG: hypothetical protein ACRERC_00830 [Candidatus Binatia bacterium]
MTGALVRSGIGALIAGAIVFANFAIALPLTGLSYDRFTWSAFAVSYVDTPTPTSTPTTTPTQTPTSTPVANGGSCLVGSACASTFCVTGVCCDRACNQPNERCNLAGSLGVCTAQAAAAPAPAPALGNGAIAISILLLLAIAGLSIGRLSLRARRRDAV